MNEIQKIGSLRVKSVTDGQVLTLEELWSSRTCVVHIMRRFGCFFTRLVCRRLSEIKPILDKHNVRLVAIALEELGLQEFLDGDYFKGELYLDIRRSCYRALGYKSFNWCTIWPALFCTATGLRSFRDSIRDGIPVNVRGDGLQMGGTLVVSAGGKNLLMSFAQKDPGHNIDPNDILKVLNISREIEDNNSEDNFSKECEVEEIDKY